MMETAGKESIWLMNLTDPSYAYLFGFIQADGHLRRGKGNKGQFVLELGVQDKGLLEKFAELVPFYSSVRVRTRTTNFKAAYESAVWQVSNLAFRRGLVALGLPEGRKSGLIQPPPGSFAPADYYRGLIDADGALGLTSNGYPFLSLTTDSEALAHSYLKFIETITGKAKTTTRNVRDAVFNLNIYKEDAQQVVKVLYYPHCLALPRKLAKAQQVINWQRPEAMKKIDGRKRWTATEDQFILAHSPRESMQQLGRSSQSISLRLWRLRSGQVAIQEIGVKQ
jgi:hypothetical protein